MKAAARIILAVAAFALFAAWTVGQRLAGG